MLGGPRPLALHKSYANTGPVFKLRRRIRPRALLSSLPTESVPAPVEPPLTGIPTARIRAGTGLPKAVQFVAWRRVVRRSGYPSQNFRSSLRMGRIASLLRRAVGDRGLAERPPAARQSSNTLLSRSVIFHAPSSTSLIHGSHRALHPRPERALDIPPPSFTGRLCRVGVAVPAPRGGGQRPAIR